MQESPQNLQNANFISRFKKESSWPFFFIFFLFSAFTLAWSQFFTLQLIIFMRFPSLTIFQNFFLLFASRMMSIFSCLIDPIILWDISLHSDILPLPSHHFSLCPLSISLLFFLVIIKKALSLFLLLFFSFFSALYRYYSRSEWLPLKISHKHLRSYLLLFSLFKLCFWLLPQGFEKCFYVAFLFCIYLWNVIHQIHTLCLFCCPSCFLSLLWVSFILTGSSKLGPFNQFFYLNPYPGAIHQIAHELWKHTL